MPVLRVAETFEVFRATCRHLSNHFASIPEACEYPGTVTVQCIDKKHCPRMAKPVAKKEVPLWAKNSEDGYAEYLHDHDFAFANIMKDPVVLQVMASSNPDVDVTASLIKAKAYWTSKEGWQRKRRANTDRIDWLKTYGNALKLPFNRVAIRQRGFF